MTWRLIYVRPLAEKKVVKALEEVDKTIDTYIPQERVWRGVGARRRPADRPLLPSMVFADLPDDDGLLAFVRHEMEGVSYIISPTARTMMQLGEFVMQLRFAQGMGSFDRTYRKKVRHSVGDKVTIGGGQFAGVTARIVGMNHARRAKLVADIFGRETKIQLPEGDLDSVDDEREAA